jgi:hypothetical protein
MEKKIVDIDAYAMGWDQFLHTAYSFAQRGSWEDFDNVDFIRDGKPFDIQPFKTNLKIVMTFADFPAGVRVPLQVLRELPTDCTWEGIINVGANRRDQQRSMTHMGNLLRDKRFQKRVHYFTMRPKDGKEVHELVANSPYAVNNNRNRSHILVLGFEDIEDLVYYKMML